MTQTAGMAKKEMLGVADLMPRVDPTCRMRLSTKDMLARGCRSRSVGSGADRRLPVRFVDGGGQELLDEAQTSQTGAT